MRDGGREKFLLVTERSGPQREGTLQALVGGVLRKECLHLMTFVSKEEKASNAITFGANHRTRTLLSYDHAVKINGNGCMDQQAQSATEGRQPC